MRLVTPSLVVLGMCTLPLNRAESGGSIATLPIHSNAPVHSTALAAAPVPSHLLASSERDVLRAASLRSPELGQARAGEVSFSDREVRIILIAVAITLLIIIIA